MKILKLSAYYAPERISSSHLSADLEEAYLAEGFNVEIYTPTPTRGISKELRKKYKKIKYEELFCGKIVVHRFSVFREGKNPVLRALRYILINLMHYQKGSKAKDVDVIISGSTPPTQGLLCSKLAKKLSKKTGRHIPFIYALHDVFPDSLVTTGLSKKGSLLWRIGRKMENYIYKNADHIIAVSEQIKANIIEKGVPEDRITVISHWVDTDSVKPVSKSENKLFDELKIDRDKFTVVYAGNFGAAQGANIIIKAAEILRQSTNIQFVIFGGGSEFESAKKEVLNKGLENVIINSLLPSERVPEVYSLGDVALISCKKGVGGSSMPSKVYSIMACNTPIIAAFDTESDLADVLAKANAGKCVEPENASALAEAILDASKSPFVNCGARDYVEKYASKEICTLKYVEVIKSVI